MQHKVEVHCECGASWWTFVSVEELDDPIECTACGATVFDLRDLGEHHDSGVQP